MAGTKHLKTSISIITQFYPPDYAATGQFVYELAGALVGEGFDVSVFTGMPGYAFKQTEVKRQENINGVFVRRTGSIHLMSKRIRNKIVGSILFLMRCVIKFRHKNIRGSHLVLTSAPPFLGLIGWFYNKIFGHTYSCIIYDIYPEVAIRLKVVSPDHWIVKFWEFVNLKVWERADSLIVLSEPMKQLLIQKNNKLAHKIHVIHSWADPKFIRPIAKSDNWFAKQHDLTDSFVVLYSGNLGRCHDSQTIFECAQLLNNRRDIKFVFIGNGVGSKMIKEAIASGDLTNTLQLPYQDKEVLPFSLTACDLSLVSILPNVGDTVAPSKMYGILAAGRPVAAICPEGNYLREIVDEGDCGSYFNNGDARGLAEYICWLVENPYMKERLGKNARRLLETHYTVDKAIPKYIDALGLREKALSYEEPSQTSFYEYS
ncbi:glycosyltransferase family 4 protein [Pseudanabaena sp. FACHB-1998]|uniref:glycosyltransferase family 4 protein n=1 Tax=Pseudanabaena sp. FACHB-1998 TaxID=2692858 RepID=UPI001680D429|nr:glycosyltransferase family 4 protein [Pseudanabaena sp. FACHB-1998]MBD2178074.1 glycosyltransferase family 4 protein [Pseudanabaena sp. FACHB-1998]